MGHERPTNPATLPFRRDRQGAEVEHLDQFRLRVDPAPREPHLPDHLVIHDGDVADAVGALRQRLLKGNDAGLGTEGTGDHVAEGGGVLGHHASDRRGGREVHPRGSYRQAWEPTGLTLLLHWYSAFSSPPPRDSLLAS